MNRLELVTLGGVHIRIDGRSVAQLSAHKAQALLVYLAMTRQQQSRQALAGLLWGEMPEVNARRNLRVTLAKMRDAIEPYLLISRRALAIDPAADVWLDVAEFEACMTPGAPTLTQLQQAAALYHGHFLDDFNVRDAPLFEEWVRPLQERYRQMAMEALYRLAKYHTDQGSYSTGIDYASRLLALEPWMEEAHRQLMLLLALNGQRSAALAQYEACCNLLSDELGIEPASATVVLYRQILNEDIAPQPQGVIVAAPARQAPFQTPAATSHFVGRAGLLAQITAQLRAAAGAPVQAIVGMGGVGKSSLAVHVARSLHEQFSDGVLWADAAGSEPMAVLESWAAAYGYDFARIADLESMAAAFRGIVADKSVLIVLDDVRSVSRIRPLLPGGRRCRVLLTTRDQDLARALDSQVWLLKELSPENGRLLLQGILGRERVAAEPQAAVELCALLQNLPLAVEITAQRLKSRPRRRLADMAQRLQDETQRLSLLKISDREVRASFAVSWESLDVARQRVFALIGLFNGRSFTAEALAAITGLQQFTTEDRLFDLANLSLLREEAEQRYRQHPLLADFAREHLEEDVRAENGRFAGYYLAFAQRNQHDYEALRPEWENVMAAIEAAYTCQMWQTVVAFAETLHDAWTARARFSQARTAYGWARRAAQMLADKAVEAACLLRLGQACIEQSDYGEAAHHLESALSHFVQIGDDPQAALAWYHLARVCLEQGDHDEAEHYLDQSYQVHLRLEDSAGVAFIRYTQARLAYRRGLYDESEQLGRQALQLQQEVDDQLGVLRTLRLLARIAVTQKRGEQAAQLAEQAVQLSAIVQDQGETASVYYVLGSVYRLKAEWDLALNYLQKSLTLFQRMGDRRSHALALYEISLINEERQQYSGALAQCQESLRIFRDLHDDYNQVLLLLHQGDLLRQLAKGQEAHLAWSEARQNAMQLQNHSLVQMAERRLQAMG